MKKLLSVILAVSLMMSLFCMVPASAENINTWPYMFEDFEDGEWPIQASGSVGFTKISDTPDGSAQAVQTTVLASTEKSIKLMLGSAANTIYNGDTIKIAMDLKLGTANNLTTSTIRMHYTTANNSNFADNGYVYANLSYDGTSTAWQKATCEMVYDGLDVCIDGSVGVAVFFAALTDSDYTISLDNIEFQVIRDTMMDSIPTSRVIYENDFSENMNGVSYTADTLRYEGNTIGIVTPEDAEANKTGAVLQLVDANAAGHIFMELATGEPLKKNTYYALSYKARIVEAYANTTDTPVAHGANQSCKQRWTYDGGYGEMTAIYPNNTWTYNTFLIYHGDKDADADGTIKLQWWINNQTGGKDTGTYQIDDLKVEEIGGIINGTAEYKAGNYKELGTNSGNVAGGATPVSDVWKSVNGSVTVGGPGSVQSGQRMYTMYFNKIDGSAINSKEMLIEAGKKYEFSGGIRPCENISAGTLEIGINYTYNDDTEANSVVLATAATSASAYSAYKTYTEEFITPDNMATAEFYVKELGVTTDDQNISRFNNKSNLAYYTDNWSVKLLPSDNIPVVAASATTAAGGVVTVAKTFTAPAGVTDASVVKLTATKNGVKSYIASTKGTVITVPESYQTGYTLAAEITPVGSNGYIGKTVTIEVPAVPVVVGTTFTATAADGATLTASEATAGTVIWAAYDVNGKMLDWASAPISVTAGGTQTVAVPLDFDATGATEVKVMLWADMVACKPLANHVAY